MEPKQGSERFSCCFFFSFFLNDVLKAFEVLSEAGIGTGLTGVAREEGGWHRCISDEGLRVHPDSTSLTPGEVAFL